MSDVTATAERNRSETAVTPAELLDGSILTYRKRLDEAIQLIGLGARAGLVTQLTGFEKPTVNRLFREITGQSPPSGQSPYTDKWYRHDQWRMAHASLVWRVHKRLIGSDLSDADVVIKTYNAYCQLVREPLLDLTYTAFVPQLVGAGTWAESRCTQCDTPFVAPVDGAQKICPGCYMLNRYRCTQCNTRTHRDAGNRFPARCRACGARRVRGAWIPSNKSAP